MAFTSIVVGAKTTTTIEQKISMVNVEFLTLISVPLDEKCNKAVLFNAVQTHRSQQSIRSSEQEEQTFTELHTRIKKMQIIGNSETLLRLHIVR